MKTIKKIWEVIKIILTIVIIVLFILYFTNNKDDFNQVFSTPYYITLTIFGLSSLHFFVNGLFILFILRSFGHKIKGLESFYISIISSFANYFIPMQGGAFIRSMYLKKTLQFPYTHFIATLYGNYIIIFGVNAFFAMISMLIIQIFFNEVPLSLFIFFGLLLIGMLILAFVQFRIDPKKKDRGKLASKFLNILQRIFDGWRMISSKKSLLEKLTYITVGNFGVMTVIYLLEFTTLGIKTNLLSILLYNCLSGVSLIISLTPGSLGIREGIFFLTSDVLNLNNDQIMQLALLDRGITILTLFFWFSILSTRKIIKSHKNKKIQLNEDQSDNLESIDFLTKNNID